MITVELKGGIGNQLFQLAFLDYISELNNISPFIDQSGPISAHSRSDYFDTIFSNWKIYNHLPIGEVLYESNEYIINKDIHTKINGYFQNYKYILPTFISKLTFDSSILSKYPDIHNSIFIHIRGGDYHHPRFSHIFYFDMDQYYQHAISMFPNSTFVVFTNDIDYAKSKSFLKNYSFIEENEIDSLFLMSKCAGGICANSSFSWWGAYLNQNRQIILPSKWINYDLPFVNYYFKDSIVVDV